MTDNVEFLLAIIGVIIGIFFVFPILLILWARFLWWFLDKIVL